MKILSPSLCSKSKLFFSVNIIPFISIQHSSRGDKFTGYARLEHGASVVGEGGRVEYSSGETMALDLEATVPCSANDVQSLVNVTKYPLIGKTVV